MRYAAVQHTCVPFCLLGDEELAEDQVLQDRAEKYSSLYHALQNVVEGAVTAVVGQK